MRTLRVNICGWGTVAGFFHACNGKVAWVMIWARMVDLIQEHRHELAEICSRFRVHSLALFGSAARTDFEPETSDLDFLVEFFPMQPKEHAHAYFGLAKELEQLFRRSVDLVEASAVRNPYILRNIEASRVPLYAA